MAVADYPGGGRAPRLELSSPKPRADSGAIFVEFLLVFVPLFSLFFCVAEFALLATGNLLVKHAAMAAVRASAVIRLPNPNSEAPPQPFDWSRYEKSWLPYPFPYYEPIDKESKEYCAAHWKEDPNQCRKTYLNHTLDWDHRDNELKLAAQLALGPWFGKLLFAPGVSCDPALPTVHEDETCHVTVFYKCTFPFSKQVLCPGGLRLLHAKASFPHQGASYKPEFGF